MLRLVVFICALAQCGIAWGANEASYWLMKMRTATQALNYDGIFVYVYGGTIEAMRVVHQAKDGVMRERIYALNGAPREVIRDAERVWCYIPEKRIGVHEYRQASKIAFPRVVPGEIENLEKSYDLLLGKKERIADRSAQIVRVKPKDDMRYGYALWADEETGLILKEALLDTDSKPIEQYMFTKVTIGAEIPDQALQPMTPKKDLVWYGTDGETADKDTAEPTQTVKSQWNIGTVPEGFALSRTIKRMSPVRKRMMEHFVYSDGLAAVSVFIEKLDENADPITGINRMGAIHAFGKVVDGYQIAVVGEVPSKTVSVIGESVARSTRQ